MREREICSAPKRRDEVPNHLAITIHRFARAHLLLHVEPMVQPISNFVTVEWFARGAFQNFAENLFRLLFCKSPVPCVAFRALISKADFPRFSTLVSGSFGGTVFALLSF